MKPERVRLFIKPWCGWCQQARQWLDLQGIAYQALDVTADPQAWDEMTKLSGQNRAPVIEIDGEVLADFDVDQLAAFWQRLGLEKSRT
jgi:glutaredoxin 3